MKISTSEYFKTMNNLMGDQQGKIAKLQSQLAVGKKTVTPSTDIKATTASLKLTTVISKEKDYLESLKSVSGSLKEEESAMSSMTEMLRRMQDLAIASSTDTYSDDDRKIFAIEVEGYLEDMRGLANTTNANGHYLFAGTKSTTMPFVKAADGSISYQGNQTEIKFDTNGGYKLPLRISGNKLAGVIERKTGDPPTVTSRVDMFKVMQDFLAAIKANNMPAIRQGGEELDAVSKNLAMNIVDNGLRQVVVSHRRDITEDKIIVYESLLSDARDIDYATAITQLSQDMLALEAAQSTFAKVSQLSLFSFLR